MTTLPADLRREDRDPEELLKLLERHVTMLREHFDSIQLFAVRRSERVEESSSWHCGGGSWYERFGIVRAWLLAEEEGMRMNGRHRHQDDDD